MGERTRSHPALGPVLLVGGGQLAQALLRSDSELRFERVGRPDLDFDRPETLGTVLDAALGRFSPDAVINAAAYTAVDAAETDAARVWRANCDGPGCIASFCSSRGVPLIHLSTDYVFDGTKGAPYVESDAPAPLGVYGASKLAGERAVLMGAEQAIVLRTAWLISAMGRNFVRTMLGARTKTGRFRVVADQRGSPTAAADLAGAIIAIVRRIAEAGWREEYRSVFHAAGGGEATWYELAGAVFDEAQRFGMARPTIAPITTADWPTAARRPADSRLDCARLADAFGVRLPHWRVSLGPIIEEALTASLG